MAGMEWVRRAVCRSVDPELFFPAAEPGTPAYAEQVDRAKAVCAGCPVRAECLAFAMAHLPYGVAGGMSAEERAAVRRFAADARRAKAREQAERIRASA